MSISIKNRLLASAIVQAQSKPCRKGSVMSNAATNWLPAFAEQSRMSSPGKYATLFVGLPRDLEELRRIVPGLLLHEHMASAYGVSLSPERRGEAQIRPVEEMLDRIVAHRDAPLSVARSPEQRAIGVCRHFTLLLASMLRSQGTPARARCGFAGYFEPGRWLDHWVCETWGEAQRNPILVDPQIDDVQRRLFAMKIDPLDVPRDRFLVAGEAWRQCRAGLLDPAKFGIMDMHGYWFIAANVLRDAAALCRVEMLPWDIWGAMDREDPTDAATLQFFDDIAALKCQPEPTLDGLRKRFERDERLHVPDTVFNAALQQTQVV
jgi:hypothetical protein